MRKRQSGWYAVDPETSGWMVCSGYGNVRVEGVQLGFTAFRKFGSGYATLAVPALGSADFVAENTSRKHAYIRFLKLIYIRGEVGLHTDMSRLATVIPDVYGAPERPEKRTSS